MGRTILFKMGALVEFILIAVGALCISLIIHWIVVPFLYGIPLVLYWTVRRYLKWRTPFVYSSKPVFYAGVIFVGATLLLSSLPHFLIPLLTNLWFRSGVLIGLILRLAQIATFRSVRTEIHYDLIDRVRAYVTPKGRLALLALSSRW
ncbi:MAG TPA: hypothetical protein VEG60_17975 [Candidatus Binatia bacterium]|nr:hypothetical protein [Candidatus Binatia bacterium]